MARAIDEKIVQLKVDKAQFESNLRSAANALTALEKSVSNFGSSASSVDKATSMFERMKSSIAGITVAPVKNLFSFVTSGVGNIGRSFAGLFKINPFAPLTKMAQGAVSLVSNIFGGLGRLNPFKNTASAAAESFGSISKSANSVNMDGLSSNVQSLASKFSVLGQVAQGVLQGIGQKMAGSLTNGVRTLMSGITGGYDEYVNKMKSITVIMNNLEKPNLGHVKSTLGELNTYADKTVYSFEDMTTNLGTFTAAGVGLQDSATAIKGIGNLAASSGSSTQQMGMAMYQLSQALASGKVGLQDWNSVVNAGMGGQKFQKALQQTAKDMGKNVDQSVSFRDSLQDGWLTSDVLIKTLSKFASDKSMLKAATQAKSFSDVMDATLEGIGSGWATVFENIIGDSKQAAQLWTGVSQAINGPIDAMSNGLIEVSSEFNKMGGRADLIKGLSNIFSELGKILGTVGKAFAEVFPPKTSTELVQMAYSFKEFTENIKISKSTLNNLKNTFVGFFSIIKIGINIVTAIGRTLLKMVPDNLFGNILKVTGGFGKFLKSIADATSGVDEFGQQTSLAEASSKTFKAVIDFLASAFKGLLTTIQNVGSAIKPVLDAIVNYVGKAFDTFKDSMGHGIDLNKVLSAATIVGMIGLMKKFSGFLDDLSGSIKNMFKPIKDLGDSYKETLENLGSAFKAFANNTKAKTILEIGAAVLVLAIALQVLASIDPKDMFKALEIFAVTMLMVNGSLKSFAMISPKAIPAILSAGVAMDLLAGAIVVIAGALKILSTVDPDRMISSLFGLGVVLGEVSLAIIALGKTRGNAIAAGAAMDLIAGAVVLLAGALMALSLINMGGIAKGVTAIGAVLLELGIFIKVVQGSKFNMGTAASIVVIAAAVDLISVAIAGLGMLPVANITKGLVAIGAVLVELGLFTKIAAPTNLIGTATGMLILSGALNVMAVAIFALGSMNMDTLVQGLVGMAAALVVVALGMKAASGSLSGAIAITVMAGALTLLMVPIEALGAMGLPGIATAIIGLAAAFTVLGVAGYALTPVTPTLIGIGAAVVLLSLGLAAGALALTAFASAITVLASLTGAALAGMTIAITELLKAVLVNIPLMGQVFDAGIKMIVNVIAQNVPMIVQKFMEMMLNILDTINQYLPQLIAAGGTLVINLLNGIAEQLPGIITAAVNVLVAFVQGVSDNLDRVVQAGIQLVNALANSIRDNQQAIVSAILNIIESVLEIVIEALQQVLEVFFGWIPGFNTMIEGMGDGAKEKLRASFNIGEVGTEKVNEFNTNVANGAPGANTAGATVAQAVIGGAQGIDFTNPGATKGTQFAGGIAQATGAANTAGMTLSQAINGGASSVNTSGTGTNKGNEFNSGALGVKGAATGTGTTLTQAMRSGAQSVGVTGTGTNKGNEFKNGVNGVNATPAGNKVANDAKNGAQGVKLTGTGTNKGNEFTNGVRNVNGNPAGSKVANDAKGGMDAVGMVRTGTSKGKEFTGGIGNVNGHQAGASLAQKAKTGMGSADATQEGAHMGNGFLGGLKSVGQSIMDTASSIASRAARAMKKALDEHSPSKVTRKIGVFAGQGLALGIADTGTYVENRATTLANAAVSAMSKAGDMVQDSMDGLFDMDARITPVVDLSSMSRTSLDGTMAVRAGFNPLNTSSGMGTRSVSSVVTNNNTSAPTIAIYQQPGESADDLVNKIQRGLERRDF